MRYSYHRTAELGWFVATAVGTIVLQALIDFDPATITDYRTWFISLGAASVRAGAGAALAWLTKQAVSHRQTHDGRPHASS